MQLNSPNALPSASKTQSSTSGTLLSLCRFPYIRLRITHQFLSDIKKLAIATIQLSAKAIEVF